MNFLLEKHQYRNLSAILTREPIAPIFFNNQKSKKQKQQVFYFSQKLVSQNVWRKLNQKIPYKLKQPQSRSKYKFIKT